MGRENFGGIVVDGIAAYAVNATSVEMPRMGLNDFVDTDTNVAVLEGNRVSGSPPKKFCVNL